MCIEADARTFASGMTRPDFQTEDVSAELEDHTIALQDDAMRDRINCLIDSITVQLRLDATTSVAKSMYGSI